MLHPAPFIAVGVAFLEVTLEAPAEAFKRAVIVAGIAHGSITLADVIAVAILRGELRLVITARWRAGLGWLVGRWLSWRRITSSAGWIHAGVRTGREQRARGNNKGESSENHGGSNAAKMAGVVKVEVGCVAGMMSCTAR